MSRTNYLRFKDVANYVRDYPNETDEWIIGAALDDFTPHRTNIKRFSDRAQRLLNKVRASIADEVTQALHEEQQELEPIIGGVKEAPDVRRERATGHTFVFTSAQSNTLLHDEFFGALEAYCAARDADLHISRFTYNKGSHGRNSVKPGSKASTDGDDIWYDPRIMPYVSDQPLEITDDLVWCGELNILPTRINPLSSFKNYTRQASGIIPHAKLAMESLPTMKHEPAKFLYTTGAVTQRNYIQKAAGQVADFHHVFGALVVEVDDHGNWWARQLNCDKDGGFYDLDTYWTSEGYEYQGTVAAITHGDIHWDKVDFAVLETVFAPGGVVDQLHPNEQFFHDSIDFTARNHHNIKDPHFLHQMMLQGTDSVQKEFDGVAEFLSGMGYREWCRSFIVVSNHDQAIEQWLRNPSGAFDPVNARFWHEMNADCYITRERGMKPHPFTKALYAHIPADKQRNISSIQEDESYRILGEIEAGLHGHLGPNGARGNPKNLRTAGKANTAHTHSAGIIEGVYTCGVYGSLDMGYNKGLSSWSHTLTVTYPNAKRANLTIKAGKAWRDQ